MAACHCHRLLSLYHFQVAPRHSYRVSLDLRDLLPATLHHHLARLGGTNFDLLHDLTCNLFVRKDCRGSTSFGLMHHLNSGLPCFSRALQGAPEACLIHVTLLYSRFGFGGAYTVPLLMPGCLPIGNSATAATAASTLSYYWHWLLAGYCCYQVLQVHFR